MVYRPNRDEIPVQQPDFTNWRAVPRYSTDSSSAEYKRSESTDENAEKKPKLSTTAYLLQSHQIQIPGQYPSTQIKREELEKLNNDPQLPLKESSKRG